MEQIPHHREGIQNDLDKAYDEGHRDNEAIVVREKGVSPELAEIIDHLRDKGYLDSSLEGKEVHELTVRPLSKKRSTC